MLGHSGTRVSSSDLHTLNSTGFNLGLYSCIGAWDRTEAHHHNRADLRAAHGKIGQASAVQAGCGLIIA